MDAPLSPALEAWLDLLAALHVAVIHFPIALILAAALFEGWRVVIDLFRRGEGEARVSRAALACLVLGGLGAALSAASGWTLVERHDFRQGLAEQILWHRWTGVAAAGLAVAALLPALVAAARPSRGLRRLYRVLLFAAAAAVGLAGHQGGGLVHGEEHVTAPLRRALFGAEVEAQGSAPNAGPPIEPGPSPEMSTPAPTAAAGAVDVAAMDGAALAAGARALLGARCVECHGPQEAEGGVRVDTRALLVDDFIIEAGDASISLLVEKVTLPDGDEDLMPPEGPRLTDDEVALLRAWIDDGAPWPADGRPAAE